MSRALSPIVTYFPYGLETELCHWHHPLLFHFLATKYFAEFAEFDRPNYKHSCNGLELATSGLSTVHLGTRITPDPAMAPSQSPEPQHPASVRLAQTINTCLISGGCFYQTTINCRYGIHLSSVHPRLCSLAAIVQVIMSVSPVKSVCMDLSSFGTCSPGPVDHLAGRNRGSEVGWRLRNLPGSSSRPPDSLPACRGYV